MLVEIDFIVAKKSVPATGFNPWRVDSFGCCNGFALVFELIDSAVLGGDVCALAEVDGLVDAAAFLKGIEVADLTDLSDCWDALVRRDGGGVTMEIFPGFPSLMRAQSSPICNANFVLPKKGAGGRGLAVAKSVELYEARTDPTHGCGSGVAGQ